MKHHCRLCELHCPLDELHCHRGLRACAAGPDFPDAEADAFAPGPQQEGRPLPPHPGPAAAEEEPRPPRGSDEPPSPFDRPPAPPGDPARPEAAPPPPFGRPDADVPPPHDPPPPFAHPEADVPPPHDPPPPFGRPDGELPPPPPPPPHRNPGPPPPFPPHDPPPPPRGPHPRPPHPDPEELLRRSEGAGPAELFELCHRALHRPEAGPLRGQGRALSILAERGEMSQRELQELLHVQPGSLSELLAKLERKGLLTRLPGEDRRARLLRITEAGRQAAEGMGTSADDALFSALNGEQRAHFTEALRLLLADWLGRPAGPGDSASGREPLA